QDVRGPGEDRHLLRALEDQREPHPHGHVASAARGISSPPRAGEHVLPIPGCRYDEAREALELHELLAEVLALEQADEGLRRVVDSLDDGFAILELARGQVRREALDPLAVARLPVED